GKAIMAFLPDAEIEKMFASVKLAATTENTIVDPQKLRDDVAAARKCGYATSLAERVPGAGAGLGAPGYGAAGRVKGAIVVTVPLFRWRKKNLAWMSRAVVECGQALSALVDDGPLERQRA